MSERDEEAIASVVSEFCRKGMHDWCANRTPEECRCSCECHKQTAPQWYSASEMRDYLKRCGYGDAVAEELSADYATNLQRAFQKGYEMGSRATDAESAAKAKALSPS
jgi:hypothetical protein